MDFNMTGPRCYSTIFPYTGPANKMEFFIHSSTIGLTYIRGLILQLSHFVLIVHVSVLPRYDTICKLASRLLNYFHAQLNWAWNFNALY